MPSPIHAPCHRIPVRIAAAYSAFGLLWILISDTVMFRAGEMTTHGYAQAVGKGAAFVAASALLIYWHTRAETRAAARTAALLNAIVEGTTDAVFVKDRDGKYLFCNGATARFVGLPAAEIASKDDRDLFEPESARRVMEQDRRVLETGLTETTEEELTAAGATRTYLVVKAPYRDADGRVAGVVGISRDITERKQNERALRESTEFVEAVLDAMPSEVAVLDSAGAILEVNEAWRAFAADKPGADGPARRTDVGVNYLSVCDESAARGDGLARDVAAGIRAVLAEGRQRYEAEYPCSSPRAARWFLMHVAPLAGPEGGMKAIVVHTDITARKAAELAVAESEARFRAFIENAADFITVFDPDGRILYESPSVARLGYALEELVGATVAEYIHPDDVATALEEIRDAAVHVEANPQVRVRFRHKDGSWRWLEATRRFVPGLYGPAGAVVVNSRDITERLELEASALRWQEVFARVGFGMVVAGAATNTFEIVNASFARERGYGPAELVGRPILDVYPPSQRAALVERIAEIDRTGHGTFESVHVRKDGTTFPVLVDVTVLPGTYGRPATRVAAATDITLRKQAEIALVESESRFRAFMDHSPAAQWIVDEAGRILFANQRLCEWLGKPTNELIGRTATDIHRPQHGALHRENDRMVWADNRPIQVIEQFDRPDGTLGDALAIKFPLPGPAGQKYIGGVALDVTDQRRAEERLRLLGAAIDSSPNAVFIADREGIIRWVNPAFSRMSGYSPEEAVGQSPRLLKSGKQDVGFYRALWDSILSGRVWTGEVVERRKDGTEYVVRQTITPLAGPDGTVSQFVAVQEDVTASKRTESRLRELAATDPLTGLLNRTAFRDRLASALTGEPTAVHFLDLDQFKLVNDAFGHRVGDELLKQVSARIRRRLRATDVVSRLGGDEFAVVQPGLRSPDDADALARGLVDVMDKPFTVDDQEVRVGVSVGVTLYPDDGGDPDLLLKNADLAMYRAKQEGRGTYRFYKSSMEAQVQSRVSLEFDMRHALTRGEFVLHYQPQVSLSDGSAVGCEALIRWRHPTRGMVSPASFLPVAEESALILHISDWVFGEACAQARRWLDAGRPLRVAVNASVAHVQRGDLVASVRSALKASGLPPQWLELEITEGLLLPDIPVSGDVLRELNAMGVGLAIDDFGTGYSSLSYLRRLPVDRLKIDRSFVTGLPTDGKDAALARAVIGLGHDLGLKVLAEGVETQGQADFLRDAGCDEAQGYLFGRPAAPVQ